MQTMLASILVFGLAGSALADSANKDYAPEVGQLHADFRLPTIDDNKPIRLSDYRGKKVLLIHFASW